MKIILSLLLIGLFVLMGYELWRQLKKSNTVRRLIDTYEHDTENPKLIEEMYDFCSKDRKLKKIVQKYNATPEDFDMLYHKLLIIGNFRKINRFVPISSFFAVYTLDYLLSHQDEDYFKMTKRMMNFFNV